MILESIDHTELCERLHPRFALAFEAIRHMRAAEPAPGVYEIDGQNVYAMVQEYDTQPAEQMAWEGHREYADIQFIVAGQELVQYAPLQVSGADFPYDQALDLLRCQAEPASEIQLSAGQFAIFFPHDLHRPKCDWQGSHRVRKLLIKVALPQIMKEKS